MPKPLLESDVRVWRETDAMGINAILNHPAVRPWVADMAGGPIDITPVIANENNVLLMGKFGGIVFVNIMPGTYECHTQILPEGRGPWAHKFAIAVLDYMFARTNAWEVCTRVPAGHIGARALAEGVGFRDEFVSMEPCLFRGRLVRAATLTLSLHRWAGMSAAYAKAGHLLHEQMAVEAVRMGVKTPAHPDDVFHDQVAGASIEMVRNGLMVKAIAFYNRWAALARHRTISVVSQDPPVVAMDLGHMRIRENGVEITP